MKNAEWVKYGSYSLVKIKKKTGGWFSKTEEFLQLPGERLTLVPITKSKRITRFHKFWFWLQPEWWKRHKRHKSHLRFLDKCDEIYEDKVSDDFRAYFGTDKYIAAEKVIVLRLSPIEYNDFDSRKRTTKEKRMLLNSQIRSAINKHRTNP